MTKIKYILGAVIVIAFLVIVFLVSRVSVFKDYTSIFMQTWKDKHLLVGMLLILSLVALILLIRNKQEFLDFMWGVSVLLIALGVLLTGGYLLTKFSEQWIAYVLVLLLVLIFSFVLTLLFQWGMKKARDEKRDILEIWARQLMTIGTIVLFISLIFRIVTFNNKDKISLIVGLPEYVQNSFNILLKEIDVPLFILTLFSGVFVAIYEYWDKRKQEEKEKKAKLLMIESQLDDEKNWWNGFRLLLELDITQKEKETDMFIERYNRLWDKVRSNWDNNYLLEITERLKRGMSINDIIKTLEEMFDKWEIIQKEDSQIKFESIERKNLWRTVIQCYSDNKERDCELEDIFKLWDRYDHFSRELCVDMLIRYEDEINKDVIEELKKLLKLLNENRCRLFRHPRLRQRGVFLGMDISDLMKNLQYKWAPLYNTTSKEYEDPNQKIKSWLEGKTKWGMIKSHPFGPLNAENAGPEMFRFYVPPNDFEKLSISHPTWIGGVHGSGRTALGLYLYNDYSGKKDVFPLFQFIQNTPSGMRGWIDVLLEALAKNLLELLSIRPDVFLDLEEEEEQRQFVLLFYYYIGTYQIVADILRRTGRTETLGYKKQQIEALKYRLRELFRQIDPHQPSYLLLQSLLSTRPADLTETHIILDIQSRLTSLQSHQLLLLSRDLEANRVYLKILSDLPDSDLWRQSEMSYVLSWNENALKEMLRNREVYTLFEAEEDALNEFVDYANGLPQRMVQLGNEVLKYVVYLKPDELLTIDHLKQARKNLEIKQSGL